MRVTCNTLWLPKKGNTNEEYEDAAAPFYPLEEVTEQFRCAVADGATETSFSALWARLLVDGYINGTARAELKNKWQHSLENKQLAWYAEQKAESGAFAALVGLTITSSGDSSGTWQAEAVGDCCLVLVRDEKIVESFPLTESEQFNNSPVLLSSSNESGVDTGEECLVSKSGNWRRGDVFYLMTDAIARWAYKRQEEYGDAALWLKSMNEQKDIEDFAAVQRGLLDAESRPLLRNDDVTLMRVELH
jgi:hypothetical protein